MSVGKGTFSVKIIDPLCPWNEDVWQFESIDGSLQVTKVTQSDCELTIQDLSALIAGTRDSQDFPILGLGNPNSDLQAEMRGIFPAARPYMHENF